ncbi:MAG: aldo/keto reductase [Bryobacterales bacterium]|nr:aldo/keto reductase [Bryobacterales bacterium]
MDAGNSQKVPRRGFLAMSAAAAVTAAVPGGMPAVAADAEWRNRQSGMMYRRLGRTGCMVSAIGTGGDDIAPDNIDYVLWAMDMGVNYFDTAPHYNANRSEPGYGLVLKARGRDKVFQNTKINVFPNRTRVYQAMFKSLSDAEQTEIRNMVAEEVERRGLENPDYLGPYFMGQAGGLRNAMIANALREKYRDKFDSQKEIKQFMFTSLEGSLKALGTDHVDCLLMRGVETPYEIRNTPEVLEAFEEIRKQGKARFLGFSAHTDPAGCLEAAIETGTYSMGLIAYHFLNHRWVGPVLEKAKKAEFGVMAMKASRVILNPMNRRQTNPARVKAINELVPGDHLTAHQKGFWWALQNPNLSGVVAGMLNFDEARQDVPLGLEKKA